MNNPDILKLNIFSLDILQFIVDIDFEFYKNELYKIRSIDPIGVEKSNRGGYQTMDTLNHNPIFFPLVKYLNKKIEEIFNKQSLISGLWGNISAYGDYNDTHSHTESPNFTPDNKFFSGIIYLQVPPDSGCITFRNPLDLNIGYPQIPLLNKGFLFPDYCYHHVESNLSNQDRISLAFNFNIN